MIRAKNNLGAGVGAFTLVELLLVLAILALLLGLLSPAILKAFDSANDSNRQGEAARLTSAIVEYWHDHDGWPLPQGARPDRNGIVSYKEDNYKVFDLLLDVPYGGSRKSYIHPNEHFTTATAETSFPVPDATRLAYVIDGNPKGGISPRGDHRTLVYKNKGAGGYMPFSVSIDLRNNQASVVAQ